MRLLPRSSPLTAIGAVCLLGVLLGGRCSVDVVPSVWSKSGLLDSAASRQTRRGRTVGILSEDGLGRRSWISVVAALSATALAVRCVCRRRQKRSSRSLAHAALGASSTETLIFAVIFLNMLGITMTGPILPHMRSHFHLTASQTGLITSAYFLGMLVAVVLLPALSDVVGRKPMLLISLFGVGIGMVMQAAAVDFGISFRGFLVMRVMCGACSGGSTVMKAYLADMASPERLPKLMAYRESAATLAFIIGPLAGGVVLVATSLPSILLVQGFAAMLGGVLVAVGLPAAPCSLRSEVLSSNDSQLRTHIGAAEASRQPWSQIVALMILSCSYNFGYSFYDGFFPQLCSERFVLSATAIGAAQTCMASVAFIAAFRFYDPLVESLGLVKTTAFGLLLIAVGIAAMGRARTPLFLASATLLYAIGTPLFKSSIATMIARSAPQGCRGFVLGVDSGLTAVGRTLAPVLLGVVYEQSPDQAFGTVGSVVGIAAVALYVKGVQRKD